jgi:8-amino-7-oxononanoate synthase
LSDWTDQCRHLLTQRRQQSLLRTRPLVRPLDAVHVEIDGRRCANFASNNYLGLTHHPRMLRAMARAAQTATGSGASGLIGGYSELHAQAEAAIAQWKGVEAAVLMPSGYQANLAAVQTLAAIGKSYPSGARFLIDKLAHASLIDAVKATEMSLRVYPHNHLGKLRRLLEESDPQQLQVVLSESIFSMDGDACELNGIADLRRTHSFVLLLDEAHASGVYGPGGAGLAAELALQQVVDVSIVTLSKALGCAGGAVCASSVFCDALVNFGRAYVYSTSVAPPIAAGALAAIEIMRDEPQHQARVRQLARRVREQLKLADSESPIVPIVLGSEEAALAASEQLERAGMFVPAVRPPTVARGASRLRVTISSAHSDEQITELVRRVQLLRREKTQM